MVRVLFLHPDLGIGGAERLVVDAAIALKERGHHISFLTNHHDTNHCFKETADGNLSVQVVGDWLPRSLFGRFYALCAYFRMLYAAIYATWCIIRKEHVDVVFCDQISIAIPVLRLARPRPKIIFYCHFPDQLLSKKEGYLKRLYRWPINIIEEFTINMADKVLVNSKFTLRVFQETFRRININPEVLYPSLNTKYFDEMEKNSAVFSFDLPSDSYVYLDINRFERKKNHSLALKSFHKLSSTLSGSDLELWKRCRLIITGGYDERVNENVEHFIELSDLISELELTENVILLRSSSDDEKFQLLRRAQCLLYTPIHEHFGIVPLEGMYMSKPVLALNSGGPTETIVHDSTGFLCEPNVDSFAKAMKVVFQNKALCERMGAMGRKRVQQKFSFEAFSNKLGDIVQAVMDCNGYNTKKLK
uniref:Alpha-1,3/1,6-mannosyltransferase ALG2 n=1 Tax=Glossina brevipalpis TaxID=37001 RepID=A0A1A9X3I4_9MUSC